MADLSETGRDTADAAEDDSPPTGPRRLLIALYAIFALAATARGIVQIATKFDEAPVAYVLSLFSGIVYICATIGLVTNRRWSRPLAWAAVGTEMVGVVTIGIASIIDADGVPARHRVVQVRRRVRLRPGDPAGAGVDVVVADPRHRPQQHRDRLADAPPRPECG